MKDEQKNFLIFALLAAVILFGSQPLIGWFFPQNPPATKVVDGKLQPVPNPAADPTADSPQALRDRAAVLGETPRVRIETPKLRGSINLKGARIDDLELTRYDETVAKNSPPIRLLSPAGAAGSYFAEFGWAGAGIEAPGRDTMWQASGARLAPASPVTLSARSATGQVFRIELTVDDNYMFTIRQSVANLGGTPVSVTPYALVSRAAPSVDVDQFAAHVGPMAVYNGAADYINYSDVTAGAKQFATTGGWTGFTDHYWLTALIPSQGVPVQLGHRQSPSKAFQADYQLATALTVPAGKKATYTSRFFAGAKEVKLLDDYEEKLGILHFGRSIDWGWFEIVEKPIFYYLDWLFRLVGNFGVAIMLLTITIRGLLFPIAQRQFASMAQMRAVQPKMKALQERHKDDKPRLQQEMMKLYKDEKVNPLAGCLPILLQIPIMFALYKVLLLTIEMRHQPFIGWIRDLSAPDPANLVNLGAYLGFGGVPHFLALGIFPLLLGISMWAQFKLNPAPMDEMQKQVFAIMPWMLMFVMAPFAVGLQLYWITSNVLTMAQQWLLYRQHPVLKEPIKKEASAK